MYKLNTAIYILIAGCLFSCRDPKTGENQTTAMADTVANATKEVLLPAKAEVLPLEADSLLAKAQPGTVTVPATLENSNSQDKHARSKVKAKHSSKATLAHREDTAVPVNGLNETKVQASIADLYKQLDKPGQTFLIAAAKDTILLGSEGTILRIKANSFIAENTGEPIVGDIQVTLKEYYKLSDMLLANLSTTSQGELLETGGMLHISASSNGKACVLEPGQSILISFPAKEKLEGMQLFAGNPTEAGYMDWELTEEPDQVEERISSGEQIPFYRFGLEALRKFLHQNTKYPLSARLRGISGIALVSFAVAESGKVEEVAIVSGVSPDVDQALVDVMYKMPAWNPGRLYGRNIRTKIVLPIRVNPSGVRLKFNDEGYRVEFIHNYYDEKTLETNKTAMAKYTFSMSRLGWINCDRFNQDRKPRIDYLVNAKASGELTDMKLIFHSINSNLWSNPYRNTYRVFDNIPLDEQVTIVALKFENDQAYLAIKEAKTSKEPVEDLVFKPVSIEELKAEMRKLDNR